MRILFIHLCAPYNTGWTYRENILPKYLAVRGADVTVLTTKTILDSSINKLKSSPLNDEYDESILIKRLQFKLAILPFFIKSRLRIYKDLYSIIDELKPNLIYVNGLQLLDLKTITRYKRNNKVALFGEMNATYLNSASNLLSKYILHRFIYRRAIVRNVCYFDKIYYGSSIAREFSEYSYLVDFNDEDFLPLAVDSIRISNILNDSVRLNKRKELNILDDNLLFITGGKLDQNKKILDLINAFTEIIDKNINLVIFGELDISIKQKAIELIERDDRIKLLGWLSDEDTYEILGTADVALFPGTKSSLWEVSVACGLALIGKYWPGNEYLDLNGNLIYYKEESNKENLKKWINYCLHNNDAIKKMISAAKESGLVKLSYLNIVDKILNDYERITSE
jgi:1,2-diacylglycerol 3-alpha-glucosyltransferase